MAAKVFTGGSLRVVRDTADLRTRERASEESANVAKIEYSSAQRGYAPHHRHHSERSVAIRISEHEKKYSGGQAKDPPRPAIDELRKSGAIERLVPYHASTLPQRVDRYYEQHVHNF